MDAKAQMAGAALANSLYINYTGKGAWSSKLKSFDASMFLVSKLGIAGRMPHPLMVRTRAAIADCKKHKKATEKADQAQPEEERPTA